MLLIFFLTKHISVDNNLVQLPILLLHYKFNTIFCVYIFYTDIDSCCIHVQTKPKINISAALIVKHLKCWLIFGLCEAKILLMQFKESHFYNRP